MCTVTFIPLSKGIYLTSNRDESRSRSIALPPEPYSRNGYELLYPKDRDAGGSWISLKNNGDAAVLLNGAFVKHIYHPPYRKSRGLVFLDIFEAHDPYNHFNITDLDGIEPFTLILFARNNLWECRWDGSCKSILRLDVAQPHIWSSATLYDEQTAQIRKKWFEEWLLSTEEMNTDKILDFHQRAGKGDSRNALVMNRDNCIYTVSITSIHITGNKSQILYRDLKKALEVHKTCIIKPRIPVKETSLHRLYGFAKRTSIRLSHWEYWPAYLVYSPLYLYWLWLSLKARSFYFFSAANPSIRYAGFAQEYKSDVYKLIPDQYYPKTILCMPGLGVADLVAQLKKEALSFPLIAKPDIGERGIQVKLLQSEPGLNEYSKKSKVNFLVQEFIDYELEAGIFYYRIPGETKGHISGIVGKEFLAVTGDGSSSIEMLLKQEDRFILQLPALKFTYGNFLDTVLPKGLRYTLVPYGNHSRGAKFIDLGYKITEELTNAIDNICQQVPGFYYGRLDIKFNSWEELSEGKLFSIIELNGAGSEPTHIYDPSNSLFDAWKEICRHWNLLYTISRLNAQKEKLQLMNMTDGIKMQRERRKYLKLITQV